jgi:hypothetical protein
MLQKTPTPSMRWGFLYLEQKYDEREMVVLWTPVPMDRLIRKMSYPLIQ